MLRIINSVSEIEKAQQQLSEKLKAALDEKITTKIGWKGGNLSADVNWSEKLGFWYYGMALENRYWNGFGLQNPKEHVNVSITCEINVPLQGIDRRINGAFVKDDSDRVLLTHRGRIGGGKEDIGKPLFLNNYTGEWISVKDGDIETEVALVAALNSSRFIREVYEFVLEVHRIKALVGSPAPKITISADDHEFKEEFSGKKKYQLTKDIEAQCDHGIVVNTLRQELKTKGLIVANDRHRDLYIVNTKHPMTHLFEVKTDMATTSLYSAVGQLLLNSVGLSKPPRLVLVIPEEPSKTLKARLEKIHIDSLVFKWEGDKVVFPKLKSLLAE